MISLKRVIYIYCLKSEYCIFLAKYTFLKSWESFRNCLEKHLPWNSARYFRLISPSSFVILQDRLASSRFPHSILKPSPVPVVKCQVSRPLVVQSPYFGWAHLNTVRAGIKTKPCKVTRAGLWSNIRFQFFFFISHTIHFWLKPDKKCITVCHQWLGDRVD